MTVSIIAIVATNGVIGRDNALPWFMPADLKRFKALTMGHHMIMGRKTFLSVGKPLPGRTTVVVTRSRDFVADGVLTAQSIESAILLTQDDPEVFICGGAEIYEQTIHRADRMYITRVHADVEGDTVFPEFDDVNEWKLVDAEHFEADDRNTYPYSFLTYARAASGPQKAEAVTG